MFFPFVNGTGTQAVAVYQQYVAVNNMIEPLVPAHFHIDALPVVEDETLTGIVTRGNILRRFTENPKLNLYA